MTGEPKKYYCGDPPHERERQRIEAEDLNRRVNWVRSRRMQYRSDHDHGRGDGVVVGYENDLRRANDSWDAILGPDGKGVNG